MFLRFRALIEADEEVDHAIGCYELETPGTGRRFLQAYSELMARLCEFPSAGQRLHDYELPGCELRSFVVSSTFPYTVFVALLKDEIVILAVADQHQEPGYWAERLGKLDR